VKEENHAKHMIKKINNMQKKGGNTTLQKISLETFLINSFVGSEGLDCSFDITI
jgi:hypothetical protein